jgi:hypothetical protein
MAREPTTFAGYLKKHAPEVKSFIAAEFLVKGGSNATLTFANSIIEDVRTSSDGSGGTAIFRAYSTDGSTNPLTVT